MSLNNNSSSNKVESGSQRLALIWDQYVIKIPRTETAVSQNKTESRISRCTRLVPFSPGCFWELWIKTLEDLDKLERTDDKYMDYINEIIDLRPSIKDAVQELWIKDITSIEVISKVDMNLKRDILPIMSGQILWVISDDISDIKEHDELVRDFQNPSHFWKNEGKDRVVMADAWVSEEDAEFLIKNGQKIYQLINPWKEFGVVESPSATQPCKNPKKK